MLLQPCSHFLAVMYGDVVADAVNESDVRRSQPIDLFQELNKLILSLATPADADHFTRTSIERRQEIECSSTLVLVFNLNRLAIGLSGTIGRGPGKL